MNAQERRYVVFTGGGTGGHVFPGLAVAEELLRRFPPGTLRLKWLGSTGSIEEDLVRGFGQGDLEFVAIPSGKLRRYLSLKNLSDVFRILAAFFTCRNLFKKERPAAVFSKGGYVTVPPVWAAGRMGIPVFSHESDFDPGLATRLNARYSKRIFVAYEETISQLPQLPGDRGIVSGNPIRPEILQGRVEELETHFPDIGQVPGLPLLIVLGGSLGAVQLNELVAAGLDQLRGKAVIIHQHGSNWEAPAEIPGFYYPRPFLRQELPHALASAKLAIARAGAGTLWELAAWKIPALLVPLTLGSRGDQIRNAEYFTTKGACVSILDPEPRDFVAEVLSLLDNEEGRQEMSKSYQQIKTDAAALIVDELIKEIT